MDIGRSQIEAQARTWQGTSVQSCLTMIKDKHEQSSKKLVIWISSRNIEPDKPNTIDKTGQKQDTAART